MTDTTVPDGSTPGQTLQEQIDARFAEMQQRLDEAEARATAAEARADAATVKSLVPLNLVPEDAGGPGLDIAETWSQHEQTQIRAGKM